LIAEVEAGADEPMSIKLIADALIEAGYTTARGWKFSATQVWRITRQY